MLKSKNRIGWAIISFVFIDNLIEPSISILKVLQEAKNCRRRQFILNKMHGFKTYKINIKKKVSYSFFPQVFPLLDFFPFKYFDFNEKVIKSSKFYRIEFESNSFVLYK